MFFQILSMVIQPGISHEIRGEIRDTSHIFNEHDQTFSRYVVRSLFLILVDLASKLSRGQA